MRDINRIKPILKEIEKLWLQNPDFRIGQLIYVIARTREITPKLLYMDDHEFLLKLNEFNNSKKKSEKEK